MVRFVSSSFSPHILAYGLLKRNLFSRLKSTFKTLVVDGCVLLLYYIIHKQKDWAGNFQGGSEESGEWGRKPSPAGGGGYIKG